jgi:hypothetical protein
MKTIISITFLLFTITTVCAQKTIKEYNFAHIESDYRGSCQGLNVVYFSPVVSYQFDSRDGILVDPRDENNQQHTMYTKWKSKCINNYQFDYEHCMVPKSWVWSEDFNEVDEKRDAMIKDYIDRGFKVHVNHSFGFSL